MLEDYWRAVYVVWISRLHRFREVLYFCELMWLLVFRCITQVDGQHILPSNTAWGSVAVYAPRLPTSVILTSSKLPFFQLPFSLFSYILLCHLLLPSHHPFLSPLPYSPTPLFSPFVTRKRTLLPFLHHSLCNVRLLSSQLFSCRPVHFWGFIFPSSPIF